MATNWDQERRDAYNDFRDEGHPVKVIKPGDPGVYDPINDDFVGGTPDTVFETYGLQKNMKLGFVVSLLSFTGGGSGNSSYQAGDTVLYIPALGLPDDLDNRFFVEYGGTRKNIVDVVNYAPGDVPLIFELLIREPKNSSV